MIKVYYRGNCGSSRRTMEWFKKQRIPIEIQKIKRISEADIIRLLTFTDQGILGLFKRPEGVISNINKNYLDIEELDFRQAISYLKMNTDLLRTPIILTEKKGMIGYNEYDIREFIPKEYRKLKKIF